MGNRYILTKRIFKPTTKYSYYYFYEPILKYKYEIILRASTRALPLYVFYVAM